MIFLRRVRLPSAGLYPVASVATGALAFGAAQSLDASGFLAVYLAGLVLGTASTPAKRTIVTFHDGLAWVAQLGLFLTLGLLVFPHQLDDNAWQSIAIALITAAVARPVAAVIVTALSHFSLRERLLLGWAGLRGATPIVFATFPVTEGLAHGHLIFNVAFFVVLLSTMLQGTTIEPVARLLGVTSDEAALPAPLVEPVLLNRLGAEVVQFPVRDTDAVVGHPVRELGLPREALLNVIVRGDRAIPPRGSTIIEAGDQLHLIVRQEVAVEFQDVMRTWRTGPLEAHKRPRPRVLSRPAVTSVRPWQESDGDPSRPATVVGLEVVDQLRTRRDEPGALVALADGRFAVTGRAAGGRPGGRAPGRGAPAPRPRRHPGRAGVVAGGRRRAGALGSRPQRAGRCSSATATAPARSCTPSFSNELSRSILTALGLTSRCRAMSGADRPSAVRSRISRSRGVSSGTCTAMRAMALEGSASTVRMMRVDPYAILGISATAGEREVAAAYRELAKRWHPDQGGGEEAVRRMAEINAAFDLLRAGAAHQASAAAGAASRAARRGAWLPDAVRRALGPELLEALSDREAVKFVTPVSTWASPRAVLAVTERRLLWLLDDAPVARVRSLAVPRHRRREPPACTGRAARPRRSACGRPAAAATASPTCGRTRPRRSSVICVTQLSV